MYNEYVAYFLFIFNDRIKKIFDFVRIWAWVECSPKVWETWVRVIPKTLKMVLDTSLLNTQQYNVRIKGKVEQSRERSSALPYTSM